MDVFVKIGGGSGPPEYVTQPVDLSLGAWHLSHFVIQSRNDDSRGERLGRDEITRRSWRVLSQGDSPSIRLNMVLKYPHSVEYEGFNASDIRGLRDQICSAFGPKVNCVRQVDF